jgi:hypothetical protein
MKYLPAEHSKHSKRSKRGNIAGSRECVELLGA